MYQYRILQNDWQIDGSHHHTGPEASQDEITKQLLSVLQLSKYLRVFPIGMTSSVPSLLSLWMLQVRVWSLILGVRSHRKRYFSPPQIPRQKRRSKHRPKGRGKCHSCTDLYRLRGSSLVLTTCWAWSGAVCYDPAVLQHGTIVATLFSQSQCKKWDHNHVATTKWQLQDYWPGYSYSLRKTKDQHCTCSSQRQQRQIYIETTEVDKSTFSFVAICTSILLAEVTTVANTFYQQQLAR